MWAGVAGGMAEYFELDPSLVRLLWVAATVVSGGLTVPVYILAWIILPRDDRPPAIGPGPGAWRDWSDEFHNETQRLAAEARRVADDVREASQSWRAPEPGTSPTATSGDRAREAATDKGYPDTVPGPTDEPEPWWRSERYVERRRNHHHHSKSTGIVLVTLGILLLAANAGVFSWIEWRTVWPLIFIGLGVILLGRQSGWWSR
jgi:phage shock protein PspC (stress-responsive transcriptional regulator)